MKGPQHLTINHDTVPLNWVSHVTPVFPTLRGMIHSGKDWGSEHPIVEFRLPSVAGNTGQFSAAPVPK